MEEKRDRRIERTQKLLQEAMLDLITQKPYSQISIQDITDHGNLSRPAFYLHYRDKDELMAKCAEKIFADLLACPPQKVERPSQVIFEHAAKNSTFYRVILGRQASPELLRKVRTVITQIQMKQLRLLFPSKNFEVPLTFLVGGLLSLVDWWLENGMEYSASEISELAEQMATKILKG